MGWCKGARRRRQRPPRVNGGRRVWRVWRRVWRRVRRVPARGRGEGLNGPVVAKGGRPLLLHRLLLLLLLLAASGVHVAPRRLVTSYVRQRRLLENVVMEMMLGSAGHAARREQGASRTRCRRIRHSDTSDYALDAAAADTSADAGHACYHTAATSTVTSSAAAAAEQAPPQTFPRVDGFAAPDPHA